MISQLALSPLAALAAGSIGSVRYQISENTNVRSADDRAANTLVREYVLPAGAVVEVKTEHLEEPLLMKFWNALVGKEETKHPFVKGITLISAPGYSKADIAEFNALNREVSLYMSKKQLDESEMISQVEMQRRVRTRERSNAYRAHDMRPDRDDEVLSHEAARKALERVNTGRNAVKKAGAQPCETCETGFFNRWLSAGVPEGALRKAIHFYNQNLSRIRNRRFITINDFTDHSGSKRMYILDTATGAVEKHLVAHGAGSDRGHNGRARNFRSRQGGHATPSGILLTGETYYGNKGYSLRLDGQEAQNRNARRRLVVMHGADYASQAFVNRHGKAGRSWGCVAVDPRQTRRLIDKLKGGSVMVNYAGN